jgi:hypothetical protein
MKTKIGIACQGGGAETAFTAGALQALFNFDRIRDWGPRDKRPILVVGAAGVLSGKLKKFQAMIERTSESTTTGLVAAARHGLCTAIRSPYRLARVTFTPAMASTLFATALWPIGS